MTAKHERPHLYVLATQPSTPNQATTSEWIIEIFKPPPTGLKPLSTVTHSKHSSSSGASIGSSKHHHHFLPTLFGSSHKTRQQREETTGTISPTALPSPSPSTIPVAVPVSVSVPVPADPSEATSSSTVPAPTPTPAAEPIPTRIFFSRLHPEGSSSPLPDIILRIAVTSIPYQHSHQITSDLDAECTSALEQVHTTPDSASWLRQALLALQGKAILPPVSHDFDVTKFLSVTVECLEKTLTMSTQQKPREVRYARLLRGLEDDGDGGGSGEGDVEAGYARDWSLPHRERKSVAEKGAGSDGAAAVAVTPAAGVASGSAGSASTIGSGGGSRKGSGFGGFWISHGPLAERTRVGRESVDVDRKPWERGNAYGGLM